MKNNLQLWMMFLALTATACSKHSEAPAPASTHAATSTATSGVAAASSSVEEADPELAKRKAAIDFALAEQKIKEEPHGQWATTANASSTFNDAKEQQSYSAWQATGVPNVEIYGDRAESWASKDADAGIEWLQVGFAKPVRATTIRIRQNNAPGAIIKVELLDDKNTPHTVYEGMDTTAYPPNTIVWFSKSFDATPYLVTGAKITLASNAVPGWNEIDAVQLIGE